MKVSTAVEEVGEDDIVVRVVELELVVRGMIAGDRRGRIKLPIRWLIQRDFLNRTGLMIKVIVKKFISLTPSTPLNDDGEE